MAPATAPSRLPTVAEAAARILEQGFVSLPGLMPPADRAAAGRVLDDLIDRGEAGDHPGFGYAIHPLLTRDRRLGRWIADPLLLEICSAVIGDEAVIVHSGSRVVDARHRIEGGRLPWHNHAATPALREIAPGDPRRGTRPKRLLFGWTFDGSDAETGALVIIPRRFDDPLAPPSADRKAAWPGEVEVDQPPGTAGIFTLDLWHSAKWPVAGARRRRGMGCHVQGRNDPAPHPEDHVHAGPEIDAACAEFPALARALRR
ncbi:MAG TPA: hypothetical protein VEL07_08760 [Planctomycetota bacterium]|nr:hypothetical protein [Planctomycetota bacterium]